MMKKNLKDSKIMDGIAITIAVLGFCMLIAALSLSAMVKRVSLEEPAIVEQDVIQ